ncbi:MCE family protein [Nocardioides immobilis]|uniref:MCE family protein n=1 Tax=Nocardioides immobilis TaxID=2049295 RepID=A0A417Y151_9ACTN|nr:MCE family protein [Nocardioides immobilis]RHW26325.1 MCE family protein [Nocardioides immobilis]
MRTLLGWLKPGRAVVAVVVAAALAFGSVVWHGDSSNTTIRARFASTEGLNVDDDVKVLGVSVGKITAIENDGDDVLVTMEVDADQPIPADARAAIVSPSLVSGRFVQLAPVWNGGDRLEDGATIDVEHTAVPVTFDDVKQQLTDLATTLGPTRGRRGGALATTIIALERSMKNGNSGRLRTAIAELRGAATALSDGRSDLFSTIENLDAFTRNLALNDAALRGFTDELDAVGTTLAVNRSSLRGAMRDLGEVLGMTERYLDRHRGRLTGALEDLNLLAAALADRSNEFAGVLHVAPHGPIDLHNTLQDQALTAQVNGADFDSAAQLLCGALLGTGATSQQCRDALEPPLDLVGLGSGGVR